MTRKSFAKRAFRKAFVVTVTAASPLLGCNATEVSVNPPPVFVECEVDRLPIEGEPCATEGDTCSAGDCLGDPTQFAECTDGVWRVTEVSCNPPPIIDAGADAPGPDGDAGDSTDAGATDASN